MHIWSDAYLHLNSQKETCGQEISICLQIVIAKMQSRAQQAGMHSLEWQVADMLYLPFQECSYDVVIEKGTMDVLFVDNDSPWQPKAEVVTRVHQMLSEVYRQEISVT